MKKVSVITPAYNSSNFIGDTIQSVLEQTYENFEMIIVDDCSTDDTVKIVEQYLIKDKRIKLIKHPINKGVACARNTALREAVGDYIAFLDSDDMWMPTKLEKQLNFMERNGYALTYTQYQKYISKTNEYGKIIKVPSKMTHDSIYYNTAIACLTVMVNKSLSGDFEMPILDHTEDQCTWQLILKDKYIAYGLKENLALYRVSDNSMTSNKFSASLKQWNIYRNYHNFSIARSACYFFCYALNAVLKHI